MNAALPSILRGLCGKTFVAENGGFCRTLSDYVERILSILSALCALCGKIFVAENGGFCRTLSSEYPLYRFSPVLCDLCGKITAVYGAMYFNARSAKIG